MYVESKSLALGYDGVQVSDIVIFGQRLRVHPYDDGKAARCRPCLVQIRLIGNQQQMKKWN
jgi:hypothetical protein